ncbi:RHS repeat domain-containing protein [Microbulbifer halophilus]|uniref:RHS repeat domain-containing protein n=1 Tax=Microbulbifer halophilus TaxID=453963 RepID=UPI0036178E03
MTTEISAIAKRKAKRARNKKTMSSLIRNIVFIVLLLVISAVSQAEVTVTYLHSDAAGSVVAASDESGDLVWRKSYLPYGGKRQDGQPENRAVGYTGHTHDDDTGLIYMKARSYDPDLQRFLQMDPATVLDHADSNPMMFNRYAHANNNPYKYVDPDGRTSVAAGAGVFFGGAIIAYGACGGSSNPWCNAVRGLGDRLIDGTGSLLHSESADDSEKASGRDARTDGNSDSSAVESLPDLTEKVEKKGVKRLRNQGLSIKGKQKVDMISGIILMEAVYKFALMVKL